MRAGVAIAYLFCAITAARAAEVSFAVAASDQPPWVRTLGGGYSAVGVPPDPTDVVVTIAVEGDRRLARLIAGVSVDTEALPPAVEWIGAQAARYSDSATVRHYFRISRDRPFGLRRQHLRGLPQSVRLPRLVLRRAARRSAATERP